MFFLFKQKTAYEMRISDWSSDVCSSDLPHVATDLKLWKENCGFCHQEAPQAYGEEEAPQVAEEDARAASQARQVAPQGAGHGQGCSGHRGLKGPRAPVRA